MRKLLLLILILFTVQSFASKIYKWVDEDGKIHYSSTKPQDQEVETVRIRKEPTPPPAASASENQDEADSEDSGGSNNEQEPGQTEAELAAAQAQLAETDRVNRQTECDRARANVAALNASVRVSREDSETGEVVRMTDDERVAALSQAQALIRTNCR